MSEIVSFDGFSLRAQGATLSLSLLAGHAMALVGPAASGKTRLLCAVLGAEKPAQGLVQTKGSVAIAGLEGTLRRSTPESTAKRYAPGKSADVVARALHELMLWEVRETPLNSLSPSQIAACELIPVLCSGAQLLLVDGQLDRLDPWTNRSARLALRSRFDQGAAGIVVTNQPDRTYEVLCVLVDHTVRFAGSPEQLLKQTAPTSVTVASENQPGVRALVAPFRVSVRTSEQGTVYQADEGQQLAARLLLEGYGDVEFVLVSQPTLEEALLSL